jgi:hypothetical protein
MKTTRKTPSRPEAARKERASAERQKDLQPAATGANRGSPAAPVMPQFVKTKSERNGRT